MQVTPIAHIENAYTDKFGIPRQSGLVHLPSQIIFEQAYADANALRGLEGYSHLWLLWEFSANKDVPYSPTVRPPRLGGNKRVGVFATRSPYRPNPIGLTLVKIEEIILTGPASPRLVVSGADLLSGTPILDIKPYLPHIESIPDAQGGFAAEVKDYALQVNIPATLLDLIPQELHQSLREILAQDPRPAYKKESEEVYGIQLSHFNIQFQVKDSLLTVLKIEELA